ncbi:MAG: hypothetical protein V3V24_09810 [Nitrospinaceae bacterium]
MNPTSKEIRERVEEGYESHPQYERIIKSTQDGKYLLKAMDAAKPVMEKHAIAWCFLCEIGRCVHAKSRAWMKEYFPEEGS